MPRLIRGHRLSKEVRDRSHEGTPGDNAVASTSTRYMLPVSSKELNEEADVSMVDRGSPSPMLRERSHSKRQEGSSSAVPPSPPAVATDVSTSGESDLDLDVDAPQSARGNISIVDEHADGDEDDELNDGGGGAAALDDGSPEVKCMWEDCGVVFTSLAPFINHLHEEHVGIHKNRYACEWTGCPRKGKGQTSRFALLSHLRSHTGEKPFTCPRPECDKSFTRSDALAKHMRVQHNINPVTSRSKNAGGTGMSGGRGTRRGDGEDEDWTSLGLDGDGPGRVGSDVVGEELLELAEGEGGSGSLADIEQSLLMLDSKSPFFTYDNLFGAGARALAQHARVSAVNGKKASVNEAIKVSTGPIPDAELGIERDTQYSVGLLLNDDVRDEEAITREDSEMTRVLEAGRREWVRKERENAEQRPSHDTGRREAVDYLSEDDAEQADTSVRSSKRIRRSSMRNAPKPVAGANDVGTLKRLYVVEKAKLEWIRKQNEKMRLALADLRQVERQEMIEKRVLLERTLELELGKEVGAIFSPPGSPR